MLPGAIIELRIHQNAFATPLRELTAISQTPIRFSGGCFAAGEGRGER